MMNCEWLNNKEIVRLLGSEKEDITKWQSTIIGHLLGNFILARISENETLYTQNPYTLAEYLKDIDSQLWLSTAKNQLSDYDRHVQIIYIDRLCALVQPIFAGNNKGEARQANETVWASAAVHQLTITRARVAHLMASQPQNNAHYKLIINIIDKLNK